MKALKTKVILSGTILIFAFIATIGTTFAWFTISTTATVESMELNVSAAENILIKVFEDGEESGAGSSLINAGNYKTILTNEDLIDARYLYDTDTITGSLENEDLSWDTDAPWKLQPATIIEPGYTGVNPKTINYIDNIDDVNRTLTEATPNSNSGHYIELKFWLLSQAETIQFIELDNIFITAENTGDNFADLDKVANATRLSVWLDDTPYNGYNETGEPTVEGDAFVFGNDIDYDYVFLPNIAGHSEDPVTDTSLIDPAAPFNQLSDLATNPVGTLPENHYDAATYSGEVNATDVFEIKPGTPTLATVLIYIEGWDTEADNNIVKAKFNVSFVFKYGTEDQ